MANEFLDSNIEEQLSFADEVSLEVDPENFHFKFGNRREFLEKQKRHLLDRGYSVRLVSHFRNTDLTTEHARYSFIVSRRGVR